MAEHAPRASEEIDSFPTDDSNSWVSHCAEIDALWDEHAPQLAEIAECGLDCLVKLLGPLSGILAI